MRTVRIPLLWPLIAALMLAASAGAITLQLSPNSTTSSNPFEADYSSTHLFIDEINGDQIPIYIYFDPQTSGTVDEADVFTNLNNRNLANVSSSGNGIPDGIVPPNGNLILSTSTNASYYRAYKMNGAGPFNLVLTATNCGEYRITARYHMQGDPPTTFHWYSDFLDGGGVYNYRDAAIVVSPAKARQMVMYEVNAMYIDAENPANDNDYTTRSTFDDLDGGPNATTARPFNINYIKSLGVNWLWVQPIHPVGVQGRQLDPNESDAPFSVGSPYSVMDFFNVNPLFSKTYVPGVTGTAAGEAAAMAEFQRFVAATGSAGIKPRSIASSARWGRRSLATPRRPPPPSSRTARRIFTRAGMAAVSIKPIRPISLTSIMGRALTARAASRWPRTGSISGNSWMSTTSILGITRRSWTSKPARTRRIT
jgi:hypothetical protein